MSAKSKPWTDAVSDSRLKDFFADARTAFGLSGIHFEDFVSFYHHLSGLQSDFPWMKNFPLEIESSPPSFQIDIERSFSLDMNLPAWQMRLHQWQEKMRHEFDVRGVELLSPGEIGELIRQKISKAPKPGSVEAKSIAAGIVYRFLIGPRTKSVLQIPSADNLLRFLRDSRSSRLDVCWPDLHEIASPYWSMIRSRILDPGKLKADAEIFIPRSHRNSNWRLIPSNQVREGQYEWREVPPGWTRLMMALSLKDCSIYSRKHRPARWLFYLSPWTRVYGIWLGNGYHGYLMTTELLDQQGRPYSLVEAFAEILNYPVHIRGQSQNTHLLFNLALAQLSKNPAYRQSKFLVALTKNIDNFGTMEAFAASPVAQFCQRLSSEIRFTPADPQLQQIFNHKPFLRDEVFGDGPILAAFENLAPKYEIPEALLRQIMETKSNDEN